MDHSCMYINLFQSFAISYHDIVLNYDAVRSDRIVKLLVYFLLRKGQSVTVDELSEAIWGYDEVDNPTGALKNLIYRCRTMMRNIFGIENCIITGRGSYMWNPDILLDSDLGRLDRVFQKLSVNENDLDAMREMVSIYRGPIFAKLADENWLLSSVTYYQSSYLKYVKEMARLLDEKHCYSEMEKVLMNAIQIDNLDEGLHYALMVALMRQGNQALAIDHYKAYTNMLYKELGVSPNESMQALYHQLQRVSKEQEVDLRAIQEDLREAAQIKTAYHCEYGTFKDIYRLQARMAGRLGISVYLALITVSIVKGDELKQNEQLERINQLMENMKQVLLTSLRSGDTISRYSLGQYIVLLPTCTYEDGIMVMQRIQDRFYQGSKNQYSQLQYSLQEMELPAHT